MGGDGLEETETSTNSKLARGTFAVSFLLPNGAGA
jgi:hypothetical protein